MKGRTIDEIAETLHIKKKKEENYLKKFFKDLSKASSAKQLTVGGLSGWCAGFVFSKVGKVAATAVGGSLLLFQIAHHQGYIKVNWNRLNKDMEQAKKQLEKKTNKTLPWVVEETQHFVQENIFLATGFAGGFLLGMASS